MKFVTPTALAAILAAFAVLPAAHASHQRGHRTPHRSVYLDMREHEFYTPAQARRMHYRSDTGHRLIRMRTMPKGAKPTDDKLAG